MEKIFWQLVMQAPLDRRAYDLGRNARRHRKSKKGAEILSRHHTRSEQTGDIRLEVFVQRWKAVADRYIRQDVASRQKRDVRQVHPIPGGEDDMVHSQGRASI